MLARLRGSLRQFPTVSGEGDSTAKQLNAQIAKQPVNVKHCAPVRIPHARDHTLGIRAQKCDRAHGRRRRKCARSARVPTERRINLSPAIRVRREHRVQYGRGVELHAREVEVSHQRVESELCGPRIHVICENK
jgi:hypothetical protein